MFLTCHRWFCVFTLYACVKPLKDKNAKTVLHGFIGIVDEYRRKPNKLLVDKRRKVYNYLI